MPAEQPQRSRRRLAPAFARRKPNNIIQQASATGSGTSDDMEEEEAGVRRWLVDITRVAPSPQLSSTPQPHSFIRTSAPRHHQVTTLLLLLLPYTTGHPPSHDFPIAGDRAAEGAAQSSPSPQAETHTPVGCAWTLCPFPSPREKPPPSSSATSLHT
jgi:hypothetical protein